MADLQIVCPHCDAVNRLPEGKDPKAGKCGRCHQALFEGKPVALNTERFHKHIANSSIPIVADFWAAWCGPCRAIAPVFEAAAGQLEPRARFVKIDVDANPALSADFQIRSIPNLMVFKDGKVAEQQAGLSDPGLFRRWVDAHSPS